MKPTHLLQKKSPVQKTIAIPGSLSAAKKAINDQPTAVKEVSKAVEPEIVQAKAPQLAEVFDLEKLNYVMQEVIGQYKDQHKNLEVTVLKQPLLLEKETITFQLNGEIQQDIFHKIKPEVLQVLRRKLNNYSVSLEAIIVEEAVDGKKKLYTSSDKLQFLREKSPALAELQRRFGLETDF
ncbi:DNA polymerase III subunits gamma and tau [Cecembia lonarensis]|uniref:DNA polymerase III subunits gamma and tau n=1 Tax=Cecembia lonarensis (strain CCUG 58316 / KCTC 22772 / LW9) TaxID=1225176 RepID=K1LYY2_CECL9|nr:DNA polymerase III subunits gamma and tau [Cecembia lonarensis]EKB49294.1 DNA polymerase III subunits gamma and tau [Cecembia lonarensis LW9]